jgi:hypothetical protein
MILLLKRNSAVNSRGTITVIIVVQDRECIGLSSIVDLIRIDKPTVFALLMSALINLLSAAGAVHGSVSSWWLLCYGVAAVD